MHVKIAPALASAIIHCTYVPPCYSNNTDAGELHNDNGVGLLHSLLGVGPCKTSTPGCISIGRSALGCGDDFVGQHCGGCGVVGKDAVPCTGRQLDRQQLASVVSSC